MNSLVLGQCNSAQPLYPHVLIHQVKFAPSFIYIHRALYRVWDHSLIHTRDLLTIYVTLDTYPFPIFISRSQSGRDFERKFYTSDYSSVLFSNAASNTTFRTRAASFLFAAALLRIVPVIFNYPYAFNFAGSSEGRGEEPKIGSRERE